MQLLHVYRAKYHLGWVRIHCHAADSALADAKRFNTIDTPPDADAVEVLDILKQSNDEARRLLDIFRVEQDKAVKHVAKAEALLGVELDRTDVLR
jgi:hypothetical protein